MRELTVFFELWTKPFGIFRCFLTERFNDKYIHSFILRRQDSCTDGGAIIEEYNFWADENAATMTISREFLHANGVLDPKKFYGDEAADKAAKNALPSFPADIKI